MDTWAGMHIGAHCLEAQAGSSMNTKGGRRLPEARSEMQGDFPLWSSERNYPASALTFDIGL